MQPILATGAVGMVGSRFLEMFKDKYSVSNIDIVSGVDITDLSSVESFVSAHPSDVLIHLAAFTDTARADAESGDKDGLCYRVNVQGTANIAKVCAARAIHLIHISTDFVFDGAKSTPYTELDPCSPLGWYAQTKAMAETAVSDSGANATILRISYPYRADFAGRPDLIKKLREGIAKSTLPRQFTDTIITPTFVDDIAVAFDTVITRKPRGIYHITGSSALSPFKLAQLVASTYGLDMASVKEGSLSTYLETHAPTIPRTVAMSNAKATSELGLSFHTIGAGLAAIKNQQSL